MEPDTAVCHVKGYAKIFEFWDTEKAGRGLGYRKTISPFTRVARMLTKLINLDV